MEALTQEGDLGVGLLSRSLIKTHTESNSTYAWVKRLSRADFLPWRVTFGPFSFHNQMSLFSENSSSRRSYWLVSPISSTLTLLIVARVKSWGNCRTQNRSCCQGRTQNLPSLVQKLGKCICFPELLCPGVSQLQNGWVSSRPFLLPAHLSWSGWGLGAMT